MAERRPFLLLALAASSVAEPLSTVVYQEGTGKGTNPVVGTLTVKTGVTYSVSVEILRNDLQHSSEYVTSVKIGDDGSPLTDLGECHPDGGDYDCTFFRCQSLATTFKPSKSTMRIEIELVENHWACDCDTSTWQCSKKGTVTGLTSVTAVGRITL